MTRSLLRGNNTKTQLKGCCDEYAAHLVDKIAHIHSTLDSSFKVESVELVGAMSCKVAWEAFEPIEPKEVDKSLSAASLALCVKSIHFLTY